MNGYLVRRLILMLPTLLGASILVFFLMRVFVPGDVVDIVLGDFATDDPDVEQRLREQYGLSDSIPEQYGRWILDLASGDLGSSYLTKRSVVSELRHRVPVTAELALLSLIIAWGIGVPIGILSAMRQDSWWDYLFRGPSILMLAIPNFWLGILVLLFGAKWFGWVPPIRWESLWSSPQDNLQIVVPAALVLGASLSATTVRFTRAAMLEVLRQDYMRTAQAKGLKQTTVVLRHGMRNTLLPLVTLLGAEVPTLIGGTVIIEVIFGIPGMGRYFVDSLNIRDYPVVQGIVLFMTSLVLFVNLAIDLSYPYFDPRLRA